MYAIRSYYVYHYIEVNLVKKALNEPDAKVVVNSVVNEVNPDYVSYSSYDATNPYKTEADMKDISDIGIMWYGPHSG